ncbi:hypothetical protein GCM10027053_10620 [Intrasporangium mesophilum]
MTLSPRYGETPVPGDELDALLPKVRMLLGDPVSRAAVYDLEQAFQQEAAEDLLTAVLEGPGVLSASGVYFIDDTYAFAGPKVTLPCKSTTGTWTKPDTSNCCASTTDTATRASSRPSFPSGHLAHLMGPRTIRTGCFHLSDARAPLPGRAGLKARGRPVGSS